MTKKILLVEDEAVLALSEARMIEKYGYKVETSYQGVSAIEIVDKDPSISLVLMDIDLGSGMDGTEAAQKILEKYDLPIVFLSSHTEPEIVEKTEGISSYGYIVKNSGETVLIASLKMAFRLYEAHNKLKRQKEDLRGALVQQEQVEEKLIKKSEELDRYFTTSLDLLCIANTNGEFIRLNPEWETVLGYSLSELEGHSFMDFVHADDQKATLEAISKLNNQGEVLNFENRYRCKDGSYRWIEWRSKPMGPYIYAAARDITERKRAEQDLKESEERFRTLFDHIHDGVVLHDMKGNIVEANQAFCRRLKYSWDELKKMNITEIDAPEYAEKVPQRIAELVQKRKIVFNAAHLTKHHEKISLEIHSGIIDFEGREVVLSICRDITSRMKAEQEKDYLMREINHRVKNNLMMISSLIRLKNNELGEEIDLSDIEHQINAIQLIHEKLHQSNQVTHIHIREYITEILEAVFSFSSFSVEIKSYIEDILLSSKTALPLGLIINELATNAVKHGFSGDKPALFSIEFKKNIDTSDYSLSIVNTGSVCPENIDIENPRTLGLQLIRSLVSQLDGRIQLTRAPECTFLIHFPIKNT